MRCWYLYNKKNKMNTYAKCLLKLIFYLLETKKSYSFYHIV